MGISKTSSGRYAQIAAVGFWTLATISCGGGSDATGTAGSTSKPATTPTPAPAATSAPSANTGPQRLDLTSRGLPLAITVPACVKPRAPLLKNEDNVKDIILACDPVMGDPPGKRPFAIQLGFAEAKVWKADVRKNPGFKRFTKDEASFLRWEAEDGGTKVEEFMLRQKVGATEYACFPQFPASEAQRALLEEELLACRSVTTP